jgi:UDP-N-acetylmuramate dehydrogenase
MGMPMSKRTYSELRGELRFDEPMSRHCSWHVGGPARCFFAPVDRSDLQAFLAHRPAAEPQLWIGLGSNLLVRDGGFPGAVIATNRGLDELHFEPDRRVRVAAGTPCAKLARQSVARGLTGAEFMAGIPGTIGGALAMNAGAFGGETWSLVRSVELISPAGEIRRYSGEQFKIGYREVKLPSAGWFLSAELQLADDPSHSGAARIRELLAQRAETQPTGVASCGSVFRNPEGHYAAALIEQAGLKGARIGGAEISNTHANFIINLGTATAADIEALIALAQEKVREMTGVELVPEVRIVGDRLGVSGSGSGS